MLDYAAEILLSIIKDRMLSLFRKKIDQETLAAYITGLPSTIQVEFNEEPGGGYSAIVHNLKGNIVTQGRTGKELFEMVNDAVLESYNVPELYKPHVTTYLPPEEVREELKIPAEYLNKKVSLVKTQ